MLIVLEEVCYTGKESHTSLQTETQRGKDKLIPVKVSIVGAHMERYLPRTKQGQSFKGINAFHILYGG